MKKIIVISKPNCGACMLVKNLFDNEEIPYESINGVDNLDIVVAYDVMSFPVTILLDENGEELDRITGYDPVALSWMGLQV